MAFVVFVVAGSFAGFLIGVMQWFVLRRWVPAASRWIVATALGWIIGFPVGLATGFLTITIGAIGVAFLVRDVPMPSWESGLSFILAVVALIGGFTAGGAMLGASQSLVMEGWIVGVHQWILITTIWSVLAGIAVVVDVGLFLVGAPLIGVPETCLFGAFTGWQLVRLLRQTLAPE